MSIFKAQGVHEFKHVVRDVGKFKFKLETFLFSFKGLDKVEEFEVIVLQNSKEREVFFYF